MFSFLSFQYAGCQYACDFVKAGPSHPADTTTVATYAGVADDSTIRVSWSQPSSRHQGSLVYALFTRSDDQQQWQLEAMTTAQQTSISRSNLQLHLVAVNAVSDVLTRTAQPVSTTAQPVSSAPPTDSKDTFLLEISVVCACVSLLLTMLTVFCILMCRVRLLAMKRNECRSVSTHQLLMVWIHYYTDWQSCYITRLPTDMNLRLLCSETDISAWMLDDDYNSYVCTYTCTVLLLIIRLCYMFSYK